MQIHAGTATVDAIGQQARLVRISPNAGDTGQLAITGGWLDAREQVVIGSNASTCTLALSGGRLATPRLSKGSGSTFSFTGGILQTQLVEFDLEVNGGTLAPGQVSNGNGPGTIHVLGDLIFHSGVLEIEIGGTALGEFDRVEVDGVTALGGTLKVLPVNLGDGVYVPQSGDQFPFLSSSGGSEGTFDALVLPALADGLKWEIQPGGVTTFLTVVESTILAGDYNADGSVNAADYTVWRDNVGGTSLVNETVSLGVADEADYDVWKANFGATGPIAAGLARVPEPAAWFLWLPFVVFGWLEYRPRVHRHM